VQEHRQAQQNTEPFGRCLVYLGQGAEDRLWKFASMPPYQRGEDRLLLIREPGEIRIVEEICAMLVVLAVRDGQTNLM